MLLLHTVRSIIVQLEPVQLWLESSLWETAAFEGLTHRGCCLSVCELIVVHVREGSG